MIDELVIASTNAGKIAELQCIARDYEVRLFTPAEVQTRLSLSPVPEVEEPEHTYFGNALRKARAFAAWSGMAALADDSGLEVDFLGGRPGVHSARYGGGGLRDRERCQCLLDEIERLGGFDGQRLDARFCCCLVVAHPHWEEPASVEVRLEGQVRESFCGEFGFGYDPVISVDELNGRTLAELPFEEVCRHGFRAKAVPLLFEKLQIPRRVSGQE